MAEVKVASLRSDRTMLLFARELAAAARQGMAVAERDTEPPSAVILLRREAATTVFISGKKGDLTHMIRRTKCVFAHDRHGAT